MSADAIEQIVNYTRPVKFISRKYNSQNVIPGLANLPWWDGEVVGHMIGGCPRQFAVYIEVESGQPRAES